MYKEVKKIHLVGIGGIGVSGLARLLLAKGFQVSGSNIESSDVTKALQKEGIKVTIGHSRENLPRNVDLLIYSNAVPKNNPERQKAKDLNIKQVSYPEALGAFTEGQKVIAVTGTNGKTTTSAIIASVLTNCGLDPSALVGSVVSEWKSNARVGEGEYFVLEADEYKRAFANYKADIAVITNINLDHLDYYNDLSDIKNAYTEFIKQMKNGGVVVYNADDNNTAEVIKSVKNNRDDLVFIGFGTAGDIKPDVLTGADLSLPGKYNQTNALAAFSVVKYIGVSEKKIKNALAQFKGTWRRYERLGKYQGAEIISDYAHHPDGLSGLMKTARQEYPDEKILFVFQPHQHNRTKNLFNDFVKVFCNSEMDHYILAEIFDVAGREEDKDQDISSKDLTEELKNCGKAAEYADNIQTVQSRIQDLAGKFDAVFIVGAGDVYLTAEKLITNKKTAL